MGALLLENGIILTDGTTQNWRQNVWVKAGRQNSVWGGNQATVNFALTFWVKNWFDCPSPPPKKKPIPILEKNAGRGRMRWSMMTNHCSEITNAAVPGGGGEEGEGQVK